ncbi:MAG: hypothetical protein CMQ55_04040, partial [Gammaproteobacteria bacterium]|nr:hypothetical protein [Gammaproteobacteria bacterium]
MVTGNKLQLYKNIPATNKFFKVIFFFIIFCSLNFSVNAKQENYYYEVQFGNLIVGKAEVLFRSTSQNLNIDIKS